MNSTVFYLNDEKTDSVSVKWDAGWNNTTLFRNEKKIGEIPTKKDLKLGRPFQSEDGKLIFISLKESIFRKPRLELLIDGDSYDYKEPTIEDKIHKTFKSTLTIAGTNIIAGLLGAKSDFVTIDGLGFGDYSVITGLIFLGLGLAFQYTKSLILVIAMAVTMLLEFEYYIKAISGNGIDFILENNLSGIIARILLVVIFIRGGTYILQYKREKNGSN